MLEQNIQTQFLSSAQAAAEIGVTKHQVAMLAANEEIKAIKVGGTLLVDPYSVRQYVLMSCGKGRPLSKEVAWAALWMLSGLEAPWLQYQQRRRLVAKLRTVNAKELVWQARKRSTLRLFSMRPEDFPTIAQELTLSGKSTDRPDIFGMPENSVELEGYISSDDLRNLIAEHNLQEDITGNVLLHVFDEVPWQRDSTKRQMPVAVVAADLAASLDPREYRSGIAALDILLGGIRRL